MLQSKYDNYLYIKEIKVNSTGKLVTGRASTSRKKTEYDKMDYNGYVQSSWFIKFAGNESTENAKKLKVGDKIIVPADGFTITTGEEYAEKKYSVTLVQIWNWRYNDGGKKKNVEEKEETPPEDDIPF